MDSLALVGAYNHLKVAYKNFFSNPKVGFPKFKSKKYTRKSYTTNCVNGNIRLEQGKQLVIIHEYFPSSKKCSNCGHVKEKLALSERTYVCEKCGCRIDRDYNASINIREEGMTKIYQ